MALKPTAEKRRKIKWKLPSKVQNGLTQMETACCLTLAHGTSGRVNDAFSLFLRHSFRPQPGIDDPAEPSGRRPSSSYPLRSFHPWEKYELRGICGRTELWRDGAQYWRGEYQDRLWESRELANVLRSAAPWYALTAWSASKWHGSILHQFCRFIPPFGLESANFVSNFPYFSGIYSHLLVRISEDFRVAVKAVRLGWHCCSCRNMQSLKLCTSCWYLPRQTEWDSSIQAQGFFNDLS